MKDDHLFLKGCVIPLFLLFSLLLILTHVHEEVHKAIFHDYAVDSEITYDGFAGKCAPDAAQWNLIPRERRDVIMSSQALNDVAHGFLVFMIMLFTVWCAVRKI